MSPPVAAGAAVAVVTDAVRRARERGAGRVRAGFGRCRRGLAEAGAAPGGAGAQPRGLVPVSARGPRRKMASAVPAGRGRPAGEAAGGRGAPLRAGSAAEGRERGGGGRPGSEHRAPSTGGGPRGLPGPEPPEPPVLL